MLFRSSTDTILPIGGIYRYRKNGETHQYQGKLIHLLQSAVGSNSYDAYKRYAEGIYNLPPINLRDLIDFREKKLEQFIKRHLKAQIQFFLLEVFIDIEKMEKHTNIKGNLYIYFKVQLVLILMTLIKDMQKVFIIYHQ